jgi:ATP-dependent DNA helicase PIF1
LGITNCFFFIAVFLCCMLLALTRLGASLKLLQPKGSPAFLPHPPPTHLSRARLSTSRPTLVERPAPRPSTSLRPYYGYLFTRPHTTTMFKHALNSHVAAVPSPTPGVASKQQSLGSAFARTGSLQDTATSPLANASRHNGAGKSGQFGSHGLGSYSQGTKRTSNGLAKSLSSKDDIFDYPTLNIGGMEKENDLPLAYSASTKSSGSGLATALFDDDDFDSDVDLDVEDPATKGTVTYPKLPFVTSSESRDSGYQSRAHTAQPKMEPDSSQPIPWSSSPLEHFTTPQKIQPSKPKAKRGFLPWSQNQQAANTQSAVDKIEEEEETVRPTKRQSTGTKKEVAATPKPKSDYLWNTTASALKLQQKNLREQNKKQSKENDTSLDDLQAATKKQKKNTVHRIFLSEEQQNVLNLVTEHKKSVFFTGSAGRLQTDTIPNHY